MQITEAIAANSDLFKKCNYDLQGYVEANRLPKERIISTRQLLYVWVACNANRISLLVNPYVSCRPSVKIRTCWRDWSSREVKD